MSVRIINADAMDGLRQLADESVHCVVTSPPYYGLRDYGAEGQIGLEASPAEFVERMVGVFREVWRVLRGDGTLWLNLGDSYSSFKDGKVVPDNLRSGAGTAVAVTPTRNPEILRAAGLKPKDLMGMPWRVAFALQADGWYLRRDIIWHKPNPMPESVTDRCTSAHEYVFMLTKSASYYYDAEAIKEPLATDPLAQSRGPKDTPIDRGPRDGGNGGLHGMAMKMRAGEINVRNKRSVWTVATAPYAEAHFATFPPALIEPMILAGCPVGGTVLDPFSGAGTTCLVADRLQRNAIGIELNPEYVAMSEKRISGDRGGLLDLMEAV